VIVNVSTRAETFDVSPVAGPVSGWRRMLQDWFVVGGSTIFCHLIGAITAILFRMLLSPSQMGIWQALKLLLSYGGYSNLGISKGAAREYTIARGRGDTVDAKRGLNLAFTFNTITSLLYGSVLVGVAIWIGLGSGSWLNTWTIGLVAVGLLAVLSRYVTFYVTILRSEQAFTVTSRLSILEGLLTLLVGSLAIWYCGLIGLYVGTCIVMLGALWFIKCQNVIRLSFAWDSAEIKRLITVGGPILLVGTTSSLFRSLDKLMILGYMSDCAFQLGCYSLTLMVTTQLFGLGNMLSIVVGPRLGEKLGYSDSRHEVALLAARSTELQAVAIALPAALAIVIAPELLSWLLPDYKTGIAPISWLIPGVVALSVALPASQYLIAVNRQRRALVVVLMATCLSAVGNYIALRCGFGLVGVAASTGAGYIVYFALTILVSLWPELNSAERLRYLTVLLVSLVPPISIALCLEHCWFVPEIWIAKIIAKPILVVVIWGISVAAIWHRGGWQNEVKFRA